MGRPLSFEPNEVLSRAAQLFRRVGFHGASIQAIVETTGMSRFSIYERFGSKEGLFYSALEFYLEVAVKQGLLGALLAGGASLAELLELLGTMRELALRPDEPAGCLVVNASLELGGRDARVESIAADNTAALRRAFLLTLSNAEARGELGPGRSVEARADHLVTMTHAFMVLAHVSRRAADEFVQAVIREVESWRRATTTMSRST